MSRSARPGSLRRLLILMRIEALFDHYFIKPAERKARRDSLNAKFKEAGKSAEPEAKTAWQRTKEGAKAFGTSVKSFFESLGR